MSKEVVYIGRTSVDDTVIMGRRGDDSAFHGVAETAAASVEALITGVGSGDISVRQARKIGAAAQTVEVFTRHVSQIVRDTADMAGIGATCMRDVAQLHAEVAAYKAAQTQHAAERAEAQARANAVGPVVTEELETRKLTAQLKNAQLRQQLNALEPRGSQEGPWIGTRRGFFDFSATATSLASVRTFIHSRTRE